MATVARRIGPSLASGLSATGRHHGRARSTLSSDNPTVIFLIGVALAIFVIPFPWNIPVLLLFAAIEVAETLGTWVWSRRGDPKVGVETLIGGMGRVVSDCRPDGTVRIKGEIWRARCDAGAGMGTRVRVVGREELLLIVEALPD